MMKSIVSQGKSIDEAVQTGLKIINCSIDEVNVEILQLETRGFIGFGSKKAIVKLTKDEKNPMNFPDENNNRESTSIEELIENAAIEEPSLFSDQSPLDDKTVKDQVDGKAWVKDGKIHVKDSPTKYPLVKIGEGIELIKNNEPVKEKTTIVTERDTLDFRLYNEVKETSWNVNLDQHKLKAVLEVVPGYTLYSKIRDTEPDYQIELTVEEFKEEQNNLNYDDVIKCLENQEITYGLNTNRILEALNTQTPCKYEVAIGKEPELGTNGLIDLKVNTDAKDGLKVDEAGNVDFREFKTIPVVEQGQIIAAILPPIPGRPGITVTNEVIPAKPTYPMIVKAEQGVIVVEDKLVATESGRPFIEQRGQLSRVSVIPKLLHDGNVNLSSGNIRFNGDVEITGQVEENMEVEAGGDIVVYQSITDSTLTTSKSIVTHGNVIGSELSAGKNNMLIAELGHLLGIIHSEIQKIITVIKQLIQTAAFKSSDFSRGGLQPLINILLEKKFNNFRPLVKKYVDIASRAEKHLDDKEWTYVSVSLNQIFLTLSNQVTSLDRLSNLSKKIKVLHEFSKTPVEPDSYITISDALNSSLYCSGNIIIIGQGAVNSKIHAGGILKVSGIVRGGELYGRLGVEINEVGSNSGTKTIISVPNDQRIKINKAMEDTVIKIGSVKHTFQDTRQNISAYLNSEGKIVIE